MARVNISVPDAVIAAARDRGLNVSRVATAAIEHELLILEKQDAFDRYLAELEAELGPPDPEELAAAEALLTKHLGPAPDRSLRRSA